MRQQAIPLARLSVEDVAPVPDALRGAVVAIGSFDGVHLGHQSLIAKAKEHALGTTAPAVALTFNPHPRRFFRPDQPIFLLNDIEARRELLGIAGADGVVEANFDAALAALEPSEFIARVLIDRLAVSGVVVGEGFRFGRGRSGDAAILRAEGSRLGFAVETLPPVTDPGGEVVSSGRIRDALREGDIAAAETKLGYRWFVSETVVHGDQRGRELGFPTANLALSDSCALRFGIYAVTVHWDGKSAEGVASYGVRPTFGGGQPLLEVHLFDFAGDLYDARMTVVFRGWIREERNFSSVEALIDQMNHDAAEARRQLREGAGPSRVDRALTDWF